ncbi:MULTISPECIES: SIR2 family protein [unclassified Chelatococcus]|uniref:SIR2 family protein n=1 Tax=unclassified Chelatococcus TaxID=2638111 RepID=UPI001BD07A9B|nr:MULTISPECIES: SIR2 family protein [unclassified Chelatococcus]MBS7699138.1 SIR2 family protein [Chelatococcus sp. YT9]MBX3554919.1 SIR2 family protein [Chelatococcus sp.]
MRFLANGPSIPDDLLMARDAGDVIFFCGAGVSRHRARLPDFLKLGSDVIELLGAGRNSLARKLFQRIEALGRPLDGVGALIPTDRIFSLLEREFEPQDIKNAVARAIKPDKSPDLSAHKSLIDLSRGRDGSVRLVTTNFDLLFEDSAPEAVCFAPPDLPDPRGGGFRGIVHLHGRVKKDYSGPSDEEFVVSSADFGRAYLSDGWATRFIQSLLARYQIVFVGYGADDPPVQYLLEALNLRAGNRSRLFAFQAGGSSDDAALWEHRGVRAISFDNSESFDPLWDSLAAWAERARDVDGWYTKLLESAAGGPAALDPHVRGQIAHVLSTRRGARRVSIAERPLPASWLLAFDPRLRFEKPDLVDPYGESDQRIDPYESLGLDFDTPPQPVDDVHERQDRTAPEGSWSAFATMASDQEDTSVDDLGGFCGAPQNLAGNLSTRLRSVGIWFSRVAHQPIALWWAAGCGPLHPDIVRMIQSALREEPQRWPDDIRHGWRMLIADWLDQREEPNQSYYELYQRVKREGWSEMRVRDYAALFQPRLKVRRGIIVPHPLSWTDGECPDALLYHDVDYPHPYEQLHIPDEQLAYAVTRFRENLDLARSLETEIGQPIIQIGDTRPDDGGEPISFGAYGLIGPIAHFMQLMERLIKISPRRARREIACWPKEDSYIFGRLRIWAAGKPVIAPGVAADVLLGFPDKVFWGSLHRRDLLYAIRDRWADFSAEDRERFERRLRTTNFPWSDLTADRKARAEAHYRLDRLHWLVREGLSFSFDVNAEIAALRSIAVDWSDRSEGGATGIRATSGRGVDTETEPERLDQVPIGEILERARTASQSSYSDQVERRPFKDLAEKRPVRALAALSSAARKNEIPFSFWAAFLQSEKRKSDPARLVLAIGSRLATLPPASLSSIAYPVAEWLQGLGPRAFDGPTPAIERVWDPLIAALHLRNDRRKRRVDSSWANDALNAPAGKIASLLMQEPSIQIRTSGRGLPQNWTRRQEQLLTLPGDMRRHVLVMLGFRIDWLFYIAPKWTIAHLIEITGHEGEDGDALWDGIFWAARAPSRKLYELLKPALLARARSPRRRRAEANVIGGFLLIGWGDDPDADPNQQLVTNAELREILVDGDDALRRNILAIIERWSVEAEGDWPALLIPFLLHVWPNQRVVRTPELSLRLVDLAFASGDHFPRVVQTILPRLVPVRGGTLEGYPLRSEPQDHPAKAYPAAMLDLLWAILAEDATLWPYKFGEFLDILADAPETQGDARLSELRRRRSS